MQQGFPTAFTGEVGVDDALVMQAQESIMELNNGGVDSTLDCSGATEYMLPMLDQHGPITPYSDKTLLGAC